MFKHLYDEYCYLESAPNIKYRKVTFRLILSANGMKGNWFAYLKITYFPTKEIFKSFRKITVIEINHLDELLM